MYTPTTNRTFNDALKEDDPLMHKRYEGSTHRSVLVLRAAPIHHVAMVSPLLTDNDAAAKSMEAPCLDISPCDHHRSLPLLQQQWCVDVPSSTHAKTAFVDCADVLQIIFEFIPNSRCLGAVQRVSTTWHAAFWNIEPQEHNLRTVIRHQVELLARAGRPYGSNDQIRDRVLLVKARLEVKKKARTPRSVKTVNKSSARSTESEGTSLPPIAAPPSMPIPATLTHLDAAAVFELKSMTSPCEAVVGVFKALQLLLDREPVSFEAGLKTLREVGIIMTLHSVQMPSARTARAMKRVMMDPSILRAVSTAAAMLGAFLSAIADASIVADVPDSPQAAVSSSKKKKKTSLSKAQVVATDALLAKIKTIPVKKLKK